MFDADDNLITSLDTFYERHVIPNSPLNQRLRTTNEVRREIFFHCMATHFRPWALMESYTPRLIADLQASGMYAMVLTALNSIIVKEVGLHTPNWRARHFEDLGFKFSRGFAVKVLHGFAKTNPNNPFEPYFKDGVMLCGEIPKGEALISFFRAINYKPKSVLFVDDFAHNLYSVYREMSRAGIECHCILYTRKHSHSFKGLFSPEIARKALPTEEALIAQFIDLDHAYEQKMRHDVSQNKLHSGDLILSHKSAASPNLTISSACPSAEASLPAAPTNQSLLSLNAEVKGSSEALKMSIAASLKRVNKEFYENGVVPVLGQMFGPQVKGSSD